MYCRMGVVCDRGKRLGTRRFEENAATTKKKKATRRNAAGGDHLVKTKYQFLLNSNLYIHLS